MKMEDYLDEFAVDWRLEGRAATTVALYRALLLDLDKTTQGDVTLLGVKEWLALSSSAQSARMRARAVRAFAKWAASNDGPEWPWWSRVPLANTPITPQATVSHEDYVAVRSRARTVRDRLVIELLWSTGMRVSEIARLTVDEVSLPTMTAVVRQSKTGKPRLVPLSDQACRLIRRLPRASGDSTLLGISTSGIQQLMKRLDAPSPHAWRRGWAVEALRRGVSETSVKAAAGWCSGAMVTRYTSALSEELAIHEFQRARSS